MASLNQIAYSIANELNQVNNHEFIERIKDRIKFLNATLLRQSFDKHNVDDELIIPLKFQLEEVIDPMICISFGETSKKCMILRTTNKVPTPLRTINAPIFNYIGVIDGTRPFYKIRKFELIPERSIKINANQIYVVYEDNYFYIIGNIQIEFMRADGVYTDLDQFKQLCDPSKSCYTDDMEYPIPMDTVDTIITKLIQEFRPVPITSNQDVSLK